MHTSIHTRGAPILISLPVLVPASIPISALSVISKEYRLTVNSIGTDIDADIDNIGKTC